MELNNETPPIKVPPLFRRGGMIVRTKVIYDTNETFFQTQRDWCTCELRSLVEWTTIHMCQTVEIWALIAGNGLGFPPLRSYLQLTATEKGKHLFSRMESNSVHKSHLRHGPCIWVVGQHKGDSIVLSWKFVSSLFLF